ncbi:cation:proton antiporter [Chthonomonas calidirosea]|uniref:cation:proton antiporter n=1 Tax=Chthonomonas calidirosea TaxID=454171 RepID=UPI0006EC7987|nr:sodium:proton antiporter [Chthonomonas calidirosea]CEK14614.1 sodium/proton antiporter, CPA1 family (TC 2.A.36) [Chthonomonas calidirosea]
MTEVLLEKLALIILLGTLAQWAAWKLRLPSILLLLLTGIVAGPVMGVIRPERILGNLLLPFVSSAVAIVLFEGGLSLKYDEVRQHGWVVASLVSVGVLTSWLLGVWGAHYLAGMGWPIAVLTGAILVVTGPTVIGPLLQLLRPKGPVGAILKWESIIIDPIGAALALLAFEVVFGVDIHRPELFVLKSTLITIFYGGCIGIGAALLLVVALQRYWIPDQLQSPFTLALVLTINALAEHLQPESGLLAVVILGIALANQQAVNVEHIVEFKETLRTLLLGMLFIVLAARLRPGEMFSHFAQDMLYTLFVLFVIRPIVVLLCTFRSPLRWAERLFLMWTAPRGIVAASVSSVFALKLASVGHFEAERLVPTVFWVILCSVALAGFTSRPVAIRLGIAQKEAQGILFLGAGLAVREMAKALKAEGLPLLLVDTNPANVLSARMEDLPALRANVLSGMVRETLDLDGIGRLLACTPNHEVNTLAVLRFRGIFGRAQVYLLPPEGLTKVGHEEGGVHPYGRYLFRAELTSAQLEELFMRGATIKRTTFTAQFTYSDYLRHYGENAIPLFLIGDNRRVLISAENPLPPPKEGNVLISLIRPEADGVQAHQEATASSHRAV